MTYHKLDFKTPSPLQLGLYIQCLANSFKSTRTIKNYISGAKTFLEAIHQPVHNFSAPLVTTTLRGVVKLSTHIPAQAPPISVETVKLLSVALSRIGPQGVHAKALLLLMYASFLRQSNLLTPAGFVVAGPHTLKRRDITLEGDTLWLKVLSSKTIRTPSDAVRIPVHRAPGPHCPVAAWCTYIRLCPAPPDAPAFVDASARPYRPDAITRLLRAGLRAAGDPDAHRFTLHSLRRSGTYEAARCGVPRGDLMLHGTWKSSAIDAYVPADTLTETSYAIQKSLASSKRN